jgi:hypothetical protein
VLEQPSVGEQAQGLVEVVAPELRVLVDLHVDATVLQANLDRLVDDLHRCPDLHDLEQARDVLGVEPDAAVAHAPTDAPRPVRAVDQDRRPRQAQRVRSQWIVGPGRHRRGQLGILLADGLRRVPGGGDQLLDDAEQAHRRVGPLVADPDRKGEQHRGRPARQVEPHLGEVHGDRPRRRGPGHDPARRDEHDRPFLGDERVDPGVGLDDLVVPEVVEARDLDQ